ncbi:MAG: hypothetical protein HY308_09330 [Gammaproteobacteria bacterium]|nr:hypothetical protein [Gammaproteobacteria bacterium]
MTEVSYVAADSELGDEYGFLQIRHPEKDETIKKLAEHQLDKAAKGGVRQNNCNSDMVAISRNTAT